MAQNKIHLWPRVTLTRPDGIVLTAQIAACSLSAAQLDVDVGEAQDRGFPVTSERYTLDLAPSALQTDDDVVAALQLALERAASLGTVACVRCKCMRLDVSNTNRKDGKGRPLCDGCFCADLDKEWKREARKQEARIARQDTKYLARGYTHRVTAWVHPVAGGDDYQVDGYTMGHPTVADLRRIMRGSFRFDDYQIIDLTAKGKGN